MEFETALLAERGNRHGMSSCIVPTSKPLKCLAEYPVMFAVLWRIPLWRVTITSSPSLTITVGVTIHVTTGYPQHISHITSTG